MTKALPKSEVLTPSTHRGGDEPGPQRTTGRGWRLLATGLSRLVVPPQCPSCGVRLLSPATLCRSCAVAFAEEVTPVIVMVGELEVRAVAPYDGVWGRVVRAYKEDPAPGVANFVEPLLITLLQEHFGSCRPWVVPVPMASVRRRERGFSPVDHLAAAIAVRLGWGQVPGLLRRVRYRRPLRGLPAAERRQEMLGAIRLDDRTARSLLSPELPGISVVLIDDVLTTGSTLDACARALGDWGGVRARVSAAVLAATPPGSGTAV